MESFKKEDLKYIEADESGIETVLSWLQKPHIQEFWGDGGMTIPDLKLFVKGKPSVFRAHDIRKVILICSRVLQSN